MAGIKSEAIVVESGRIKRSWLARLFWGPHRRHKAVLFLRNVTDRTITCRVNGALLTLEPGERLEI